MFDLGAVLPHEPARHVLGQFLRALFGYTATPELTTFVVWLTYVVVVLTLFLRPLTAAARRQADRSADGAGQAAER